MRHLARTSLFAALSLPAAIQVHALEPGPATAASGPDASSLEEVVVEGRRLRKASSPKLTQPLADTPQTIVVIPREVFTQQAQTSLRDVLRNTSGITIQAGEGGSAPGDNIFIRGFGARNDVYIDGVRDPGVLNRDTFNIESVEVAKGPASTISGRGSTGGAINLVTRMAGSTDVADFRVTGGTAGYARANRRRGHRVRRNRRIPPQCGVDRRRRSGTRRRQEPQQGHRAVARAGVGTPTRLYVNLSHLKQDNLPDYGLPATLPQNMPPGQTVEDLDWSNFYGLKSRDHETIRSDQASIIVEHDFEGGAQLRNTTRYGRNVRDTVVTPPRAASLENGGNDPGFDPDVPQIRRTDTKYQDRVDRIIANQTNLTLGFDTGAVRHAVVAGLELSREDSVSYAGATAASPRWRRAVSAGLPRRAAAGHRHLPSGSRCALPAADLPHRSIRAGHGR